jgi:hypothetical protein
MAMDGKYGRVTLEYGDVGDDEPVIVFRARDILLPQVLAQYYALCKSAGSPQQHLDIIQTRWHDIVEWQDANGSRIPTSGPNRIWTGGQA